ncbi:MAG: hypothetical protein GY796_12490 [Chloroflexi bacterium]|nr:hypothetical protein [Chloroflexota bacterium]
MSSGIFLLTVAPLLAAFVAWLLGRWARLTAVWGITFSLLLWYFLGRVLLAVDGREVVAVLGPEVVFTAGVQALFQFLWLVLALLFLFTFIFPTGSTFVAGCLLVMAPLALALMIRPYLFAPIFLLLALGLTAVVIQDGQAGPTKAATRMLATAVVGIPFFLLAGWLLSAQAASLAGATSRIILLGSLILLAGFPFHVWATSVIRHAPPPVWVFVFGIVQLAVTAFVFQFLAASNSVDDQAISWLRLSSGVTFLVAVLLMATAVQVHRLIAGALLVDMGLLLLTVTLPLDVGWETAVILLVARLFTLLLLALALLLLKKQEVSQLFSFENIPPTIGNDQGVACRLPFTMALLGVGIVSLLGVPLTIGFGSHWLALQMIFAADLAGVENTSGWLAVMFLLAVFSGLVAFIRLTIYYLTPSEKSAGTTEREHVWLRIGVGMGLLLATWLAVQPQIWLGFASDLARSFLSSG